MKYTLLLIVLFIPLTLFAQPSIQWQKCLGGTLHDQPGGMLPTRDGGYIMAAQSASSDGDLTANHGNYDLWIVKLSASGAVQWQKSYGGSGEDDGGAIIESIDGGYIIASSTNSTDGDLTGIYSGDGSHSDIWVLKIDSLGKILWQKTFGGSKTEYPTSIVNGGEGQYVISAVTNSDDGDVKGFHGGSGGDIWVFSISETGTFGWQKTFGGTGDDFGAITDIPGGYVLAGYTASVDGDVTGRVRDTSYEVWLVKLDLGGNILWQKTYGGSGFDAGYALTPTVDHGFIIGGLTGSDDGDVSGLHLPKYFFDCWLLKVDSIGLVQWQKCLGGSNGDVAYSMIQTSDQGYVVSAGTASSDGDVTGFHGANDCWIFKLSRSGDLVWQETLGGSGSDANNTAGILPTADSGFLVVTSTWSHDGDVHGLHGDSNDVDIWLVKLSQDPSGVPENGIAGSGSVSVFPNPSAGKSVAYYDLQRPSVVKVELFNPLGQKLRTLLNTKEDAGAHEHSFDISGLPSGSYFLRIEIEGKSVLKTIELIK